MNSLENNLFHYKATVVSVYDADAIRCDINCGFGIMLKNTKIRLGGIETPELRGDELKKGLVARDSLREKILGKDVLLQLTKNKKCKSDRYLAIVHLLENDKYVNINDWLVKNNHVLNNACCNLT